MIWGGGLRPRPINHWGGGGLRPPPPDDSWCPNHLPKSSPRWPPQQPRRQPPRQPFALPAGQWATPTVDPPNSMATLPRSLPRPICCVVLLCLRAFLLLFFCFACLRDVLCLCDFTRGMCFLRGVIILWSILTISCTYLAWRERWTRQQGRAIPLCKCISLAYLRLALSVSHRVRCTSGTRAHARAARSRWPP